MVGDTILDVIRTCRKKAEALRIFMLWILCLVIERIRSGGWRVSCYRSWMETCISWSSLRIVRGVGLIGRIFRRNLTVSEVLLVSFCLTGIMGVERNILCMTRSDCTDGKWHGITVHEGRGISRSRNNAAPSDTCKLEVFRDCEGLSK